MLRIKESPLGQALEPLANATVVGAGSGTWSVLDGQGREYVRRGGKAPFAFRVAGALGRHEARRLDGSGRVADSVSFRVDCRTGIDDDGGVYRQLLQDLVWTLFNHEACGDTFRKFKGRYYPALHWWLRDGVHSMKGRKFFDYNGDRARGHVDLYADSQREDGMVYDNYYPHDPHGDYFDLVFAPGRVALDPRLVPGARVRVGQAIGGPARGGAVR
jgi:hypothetical protein